MIELGDATSNLTFASSKRAADEWRRPANQQATTKLLVTNCTANGRPEDAAHKRRRRQGTLLWQLIYSHHTIQIRMLPVLVLVAIFSSHPAGTSRTRDILPTAPGNGGGRSNPPDYFKYYFPGPNNTTMIQTTGNHQRQPLPRSQPRQHSPRAPKHPIGRENSMLMSESTDQRSHQWIPIVAQSTASINNNNRAVPLRPATPAREATQQRRQQAARLQLAGSDHQHSISGSAGLLDYPAQPAASAPRRQQQQQHQRRPQPHTTRQRPTMRLRPVNHQNRNRTATGGSRQGRGREIQLAQGSHVYHQRNNYSPPPPVHSSTHHYHHHHHHHWPPMPHRTPRYQHSQGPPGELGPLDSNELDGSLPGGAAKMYKRVLLCDKTLVSLDYIRSLDAEPRPYGVRVHSKPLAEHLASYHLDDHEINEITDNFLDLEGNFDSSPLSRSSSAASNSTSAVRASGANVTASYEQPPVVRVDRLAPNETSAAAAVAAAATETISIDLTEHDEDDDGADTTGGSERRGHALSYRESLLSDQDPLVRCDMWDLEKGLKSRKPPAHILRMAIRADFDTVRDAINRCRQLSERTLPPEDEYRGDGGLEVMSTEDLVSLFSMKRGLMPGTKWCGLGDQAETYNDLGPKHRIDICCRAHDHCPIRSKPFRNDYGVLNIGLYTKSHCDCDADFYRCLREVRSRTADMLGNLYFNVMKLQCMREERLKVCREMKPLALGFERCIRYEDSPSRKTVFKFTTPPVAY